MMDKNIYIVECIGISGTMTLYTVYKMTKKLGRVGIYDQHTG